MNALARLAALAALLAALVSCASLAPHPRETALPSAAADDEPVWRLNVASWNLLNFGDRKAGLPPHGPLHTQLLDRMATIVNQYEIVFIQEVLNAGGSVTTALAGRPAMAGYDCTHVSQPAGRAGRQELYALCYLANNGYGTIALNQFFDYLGNNYTAVNGSIQTAQNVWMRPPVRANFTFTPNDASEPPITFNAYTIHTKPSYGAQARPPGTPANALANTSTHNELAALEQNLAPGALRLVIGDLNADCASYPAMFRGADFAGWSWRDHYGQPTNTAPASACGYDRSILNPALDAYYKRHGIHYDAYDNNTRPDGRRVSDHYLAWVELGADRRVKRRRLMSSLATPVAGALPSRSFTVSTPAFFNGSGLPTAASAPLFFIVPYVQTRSFASFEPFPLDDVRGQPTPVTITSSGTFSADVQWAAPAEGAYNLVLDVNGDHEFDRADGDVVNHAQQIDVLVSTSTAGHNDVVTLGDNSQLRDLFSTTRAINVYLLAKNLPAGAQGTAYVVSTLLLRQAGYETWEEARRARVELGPLAIPVNAASGPLMVAAIPDELKKRPFVAASDGTLYTAVWERPATLSNVQVFTAPPPDPVYLPEYAGPGIPGGPDPCADAYQSTDENFQEVCNVGHLFAEYYGEQFNVVLDVNDDGRFDAGDKVDTRDIGDMRAYFAQSGHTTLGPGADGDPAVGEWKEYLSRALSLNVPLSPGDDYGPETEAASARYVCSEELPKSKFDGWIVPDSEIGFRLVPESAYVLERSQETGVYVYASGYLGNVTYAADTDVCLSAEELQVADISVGEGANVVMVSQEARVTDDITVSRNATYCMAAVTGLETVATAGFIGAALTPDVTVSKGAALLFLVGEAALKVVGEGICTALE